MEVSDFRLNRFTNTSTQHDQALSKDEASTFKQPPNLNKQINNIQYEKKMRVFSFLLVYMNKGFKFRTSWPERKEMLQNLKKFIDDFKVNSLVSGEKKDKYRAILDIPEDRETYPMIRLYTSDIGHKVLFHGQLLPSSDMNDSEKLSRGHTLFRVLEIELKYYFVNEIKTGPSSIPNRLYRGEYWDDRKLEHIQSILNESAMKRFVKQYVPLFSSSAEESVAKRFVCKPAPKPSLHKCLFEVEIIEMDATYLEKFRRVCPQCEIIMNVATDVSQISSFPAEKEFILLDGPMAIISCEKGQINSKHYFYKVHFQMVNAKLQGVWYEPYQNLFKKICHYSLFAANKSNTWYNNEATSLASQLDSYFDEFERCYNYIDQMMDQHDSTRVSIARLRSWHKFTFYDFVVAKFPQQTDKNVDGRSSCCPQIYRQLKINLNVLESKIKDTSYWEVFKICDQLLDAIIAYFEAKYDRNVLLNSFCDNYSKISAQSISSSSMPLLNGRILTEVEQYLDTLPSSLPSNYHSLEKCHNDLVHMITSFQSDQASSVSQSFMSSNVQPHELIASLISHVTNTDTTKTSFFSNFKVNKVIGAFITILLKIKEKSSDDESIQELFNRFDLVSTYFKAMPSLHFANNEVLSSFVNKDGITFLKLLISAARRVLGPSDAQIKEIENLVESLEKFNDDSVTLSILEDEKRKNFWLFPLEKHITYVNLMLGRNGVRNFLDMLIRSLFTTLIVNLTSAEQLDLGQYSWIIGKKSDTVFSADDTFAMD